MIPETGRQYEYLRSQIFADLPENKIIGISLALSELLYGARQYFLTAGYGQFNFYKVVLVLLEDYIL